ncbi:hypothetical protein C3B58_04205 [Lactonifactor longoviformis]|nr:hypothetical protein C3B58_04205 [Lactonifactor longoviformis]
MKEKFAKNSLTRLAAKAIIHKCAWNYTLVVRPKKVFIHRNNNQQPQYSKELRKKIIQEVNWNANI